MAAIQLGLQTQRCDYGISQSDTARSRMSAREDPQTRVGAGQVCSRSLPAPLPPSCASAVPVVPVVFLVLAAAWAGSLACPPGRLALFLGPHHLRAEQTRD
eukprot:1194965-Rhodomonas_salina.1